MGPTGELFEPLGQLTEADAVESFGELARGLKDGGADIAWIETMSARRGDSRSRDRSAAGRLPYTATCSFDTAGRTMMGLLPGDLSHVFDGLAAAARGDRRQLRGRRQRHPGVAAGDDRTRCQART